MSDPSQPQPGESVSGIEYPSALAALEDRQIFAISPIEGGFEIREKGCDEHFVRLLPEQLRELGEELIALAATMPTPPPAASAPHPTAPPLAPADPASRGHTITIPSSVWDARVTQEFQSRIAKLDEAESPKPPSTRRPDVKPWIKP